MQTGTEFRRDRTPLSLLRTAPILLGLLVLAPANFVHAETALQAGEELTYSVRWAVLPSAGQIRIAAAQQNVSGSPRLSITTDTETRGIARSLLTFQARSESIFDANSGRLVSL